MFRLEVTGSVHRMHEVSNGFYLDKMAAIMLTTGVSLACAGYLFLGSRLGNSLLLRFASREVGQARRVERGPPSKRLDMQGDWPVTEPEMDADFK